MTLHVCPSEVMEDEYLTSDLVVFTVVAALIFVVTSLVFFLYDCLVRNRHREQRRKKERDQLVQRCVHRADYLPTISPIDWSTALSLAEQIS
jgi:hypothetical protein